VLASIFGLVNIFARSLGGICSDWTAKRYGMRGRIWALFISQCVEGVFCIFMGMATIDKTPPDFFDDEDTVGFVKLGAEWIRVNGTDIPGINRCGAGKLKLTDAMKEYLPSSLANEGTITLQEAPSPWGNGDDCISQSDTVFITVFLMFLFSLAVQMAEGLTFGIVPTVSRPALGIVSGMVGAGGNCGALITNVLFFGGGKMRSDGGYINMGWTIIAVTFLLVFIYFPDSGGMFFKAGALKYDPQLIKPPADYRGADSMDYTNVQADGTNTDVKKEITSSA
jgi:NNP family nitrate/nitrite transporter-like MFS transporter